MERKPHLDASVTRCRRHRDCARQSTCARNLAEITVGCKVQDYTVTGANYGGTWLCSAYLPASQKQSRQEPARDVKPWPTYG